MTRTSNLALITSDLPGRRKNPHKTLSCLIVLCVDPQWLFLMCIHWKWWRVCAIKAQADNCGHLISPRTFGVNWELQMGKAAKVRRVFCLCRTRRGLNFAQAVRCISAPDWTPCSLLPGRPCKKPIYLICSKAVGHLCNLKQWPLHGKKSGMERNYFPSWLLIIFLYSVHCRKPTVQILLRISRSFRSTLST